MSKDSDTVDPYGPLDFLVPSDPIGSVGPFSSLDPNVLLELLVLLSPPCLLDFIPFGPNVLLDLIHIVMLTLMSCWTFSPVDPNVLSDLLVLLTLMCYWIV
jgi:hypothetical protein